MKALNVFLFVADRSIVMIGVKNVHECATATVARQTLDDTVADEYQNLQTFPCSIPFRAFKRAKPTKRKYLVREALESVGAGKRTWCHFRSCKLPITMMCIVCGMPESATRLIRFTFVDDGKGRTHPDVGRFFSIAVAKQPKNNDSLVCEDCVRGIKRIPFSDIEPPPPEEHNNF